MKRWHCMNMSALMMMGAASVALGNSGEVSFPNFSDTSGLQLNGNAQVAHSEDGAVLRIVPAIAGQAGSAFSTSQLQAAAFSTFFTFRMSERGGTLFDGNTTVGADGLVFVVQPNSSSAGSGGAGIGYQGINNSVGVEFDTWHNSINNDPDSNHLGIDLNGVVDHGQGAPHTVSVSPDFDNDTLWYAWIDYDGTNLDVRAAQTSQRPTNALLSEPLDLKTILNGDTGFVGFTSGTGSDWENVDIINWTYRQEFDPIGDNNPPVTAVPLPPAVWSGAIGLLLTGLFYKRLRKTVA